MKTKSFRQAIRDRRIATGKKHTQVARELGVSRPAVYSWETGVAAPQEDKWAAISEWLGLESWRELEAMIEYDRATTGAP